MIVVTGGTGFLGNVIVRTMLARGQAVRAIGRDPDRCAVLESLGATVVRGDLRDADIVKSACRDAAAVIHAGALSEPYGPREIFYASNVVGTRNVIAACLSQRVDRLVHISSPAVVFDGSDQVNACEDTPYPKRYSSNYAWSKRMAEECVRAAKLDTVIIRPKAIFGEGDVALLPRIIQAARMGRLPQIGHGRNRVDITYVDNVVHAICLALQAPCAAGRTYTITNGEHVALWPLITRVLACLGLRTELRRIPVYAALAIGRALELYARLAGGEPFLTRYMVSILAREQTYDISAAQQDLGYEPVVSIEQGIETTLSALLTANASASVS